MCVSKIPRIGIVEGCLLASMLGLRGECLALPQSAKILKEVVFVVPSGHLVCSSDFPPGGIVTLRLDFSDATPTSDTGAAIGSVAAQVLPESGPRTSEGTVCNDIDFNNDELYVDLDDFFALLSRYAEGPCLPLGTTCDAIDFNNDGSLFDPCDIDSLLLVFSEGPCTACGV